MEKYWTTIDGTEIEYSKISDSHLLNILKFIKRRSKKKKTMLDKYLKERSEEFRKHPAMIFADNAIVLQAIRQGTVGYTGEGNLTDFLQESIRQAYELGIKEERERNLHIIADEYRDFTGDISQVLIFRNIIINKLKNK